jgi:drug/metabolite transporter (DMT)-like permease
MRAAGCALALYLLMRVQGVIIAIPRGTRLPALVSGVLHAVQSYCLYSAVALIPAALALLVFHTAPMLFVLLSWAMGKEHARASALAAMLLALVGLGLALNLMGAGFSERWAAIGVGASWAFAGAVSFTLVLYINANALKSLDGRLRTFIMTSITALVVLASGAPMDALATPRDLQGWLGLLLLTICYSGAMCALFITLPRLAAASTVALNFEPIALLGMGWIFLGQAVAPLQIVGAFLTVGAIAWLSFKK